MEAVVVELLLWLHGLVLGWFKNWRLMLISTGVEVEVYVELGNIYALSTWFTTFPVCLPGGGGLAGG